MTSVLSPTSSLAPAWRRRLAQASALAIAVALGACARNANVETALKAQGRIERSTLVQLAQGAAARGEHYAAIPLFRRAHMQDSGAAAPLIGLGRSLVAVGQYGEAVKVFTKATAKEKSAAAFAGLGAALLYTGDYGSAVDAYRQASALGANDAAAHAGLGVALDAAGRHDEALAVFRRAAADFPNALDIRSNLGLSLALHGEAPAALDILEAVVRAPQSTARHRQNLALAYALAGDVKRAAAMAAIDLDRDGVIANLSYVEALRGLPENARMAAVLGSGVEPVRTIEGHPRRGLMADDAWARATVARLLPQRVAAVTEPAPAPAPEEESQPQDPVALGGVPPLMDPSGWAVQIAAYRKLAHLAPGWRYLSSKYADIIGHLEPRRSEVTHPPATTGPVGFFYRLNAGPLTSAEEAKAVCAALHARGGVCWVRPPEPAEGHLPDDPAVDENFTMNADHDAVMNVMAQSVVAAAPSLDLRPLPDTAIAAPPLKAETAPPLVAEEPQPQAVAVAVGAPAQDAAAPLPATVEARAATFASAEAAPQEAPALSFGGDPMMAPEGDAAAPDLAAAAMAPPPEAAVAAAGKQDVESIPANFGDRGMVRLGPPPKPAIDVAAAFEEAEAGQFEESGFTFTTGLPAMPEAKTVLPVDEAADGAPSKVSPPPFFTP
ncbi:MAG: tetratricopeptide repeat protein [Pseudomonadota bacterium]